jgi:hypothetical protein
LRHLQLIKFLLSRHWSKANPTTSEFTKQRSVG